MFLYLYGGKTWPLLYRKKVNWGCFRIKINLKPKKEEGRTRGWGNLIRRTDVNENNEKWESTQVICWDTWEQEPFQRHAVNWNGFQKKGWGFGSVKVQNGFEWLRKLPEFSGTQKRIIGFQKSQRISGTAEKLQKFICTSTWARSYHQNLFKKDFSCVDLWE